MDTKESIKEAILIAGSQTALSNQMDVTRQMVSRWLKTGKISLQHYLKLNQYINYNSIKKDVNLRNS
jgi:hypothetical protein